MKNMNKQMLHDYCASKMGAVLDYPFGADTAVFKVGGKIFALLYEENSITRISLKCEPMHADFLRQNYSSVTPGYHLNKVHWNTIFCGGDVPDDMFYDQIDNSHELILKSLSKKMQKQLELESHPLYLFPDPKYQPLEVREGDEYFPNGIFIFNITRLLDHVAVNRSEYATDDIRVADYISSFFSKLEHEDCADADIRTPIVLAEISPGRFNVIDGSHRLWKAHNEGIETLKAYILPPKQHSLFITRQEAYDTYLGYWNGKLEDMETRKQSLPSDVLNDW